MSFKKLKVIVIGLPKTGTSTITVMLRILGYEVTGPDIHFEIGNTPYLKKQFEIFDGFQDYPWCFEWWRFREDDRVLFIELKREKAAWWRSFYDSYGGKETNYLSYPYFKIAKSKENQEGFLEFFEQYYDHFASYKKEHPQKVLSVDIKNLSWQDLCVFLNEPIPKNLWGKIVKKPHVNQLNYQRGQKKKYLLIKRIRNFWIPIIGVKRWQKLMLFLRKNGI
ncbi:sulfotransferase [Mangrovimonas sp. ST2L15]|uniref:sulfotransferase n=1 Tax=Mangrovimonas sp. ST2L15 TaxID=1645916 RepID=UPI0006B57E89|nr:sulfotransferase [Mangrovimonas sp. ST2L15]